MERFSDIEVSNKQLTPIDGYQSEKLVSIEKALEPIVSQIDKLPKYIEMAIKDCHHPSEHGLSKDESASVYIYTMDWGNTSLYRVLNGALRSENRHEIKAWFSYLKLFDTALQKLPTIKGAVWRGIDINMEKKFTRDQVLTWWGISSCSLSPKVIGGFLKNSPDETIFLIEVINGKKVSGYTEYPNEEEVILHMGTQLRVNGHPLKLSNGSHIVHFIETNDDINSDSSAASKLNDFFRPIRYEYLLNSRIQRLMNEAKTVSIEQSYVNLAIVETKEQQEKEKELRKAEHNDAIISSFEDIYGTKTSVDVKDIFQKCKDPTKKVLVLGRAGIGKSTFCRYVCYQWAKNELWTQYQLVVLIRLRLLTSDHYPQGPTYSPIDIVKKEYFPYRTIPDKDKEHFEELCDKGQVLWLLDGYDEFVQNIPKHLEDLFEHILKTQHHILTSRPYSITLSYDAKMEITGFTDDNIGKYVEQFFDHNKDQVDDASPKVRELLSYLKTNPGIWGVAHIPVNLEMICSLWIDNDGSKADTYTLTGLYDNMTEWLCRRYLTKRNIDNRNMRKKTVYTRCKDELAFLESLAFRGMGSNCIILTPDLLEEAEKETNCNLDDHPELLQTGILHSLKDKPIGSHINTQTDYYFVHLSFQEHFAARYLVNKLHSPEPQRAIEFIKNNKYNQRFALVFAFASGLLCDKDLKQSLDTFWDILLADPLDIVGFRHIQLVISCLGEGTEGAQIRSRIEFIDNIRRWIKYVLSTRSNTLRTQLNNSLQRSPSLVKESTISNQLIDLMNSSKPSVRSNTCELISALSTYNPQQEFIAPLMIALGDEDENVKESACDALGAMGEKAATSEVISKLVCALGDKDEAVRSRACDTLGKMGEKGATSEVISKLVCALGDKYWIVRRSACDALGAMGEKGATSEVISKLASSLADEKEDVRKHACEVLRAMGEKATTSEVISELVSSALGDEDWNVRNSACAALSAMGEKAATSDVISKFVSALGDEDENVRYRACVVLNEIGEKEAISEVISKLLTALGDGDSNVRERACVALGAIGEKAATSDVISKLVSALGDGSSNVRERACVALGAIGEKAATSEVISKLLTALGDGDSNVRERACVALGAIGEKAATSEVISKLLTALGDENWNVRSRACNALGAIGEKAATSEVISKLVCALGDKDEAVRSRACDALGKMGEKGATSEVISKLVCALGDEKENVRKRACDALGAMGEKAATSEVISKLVCALGDKDEAVRSRACDALGKMGEKGATSEVISKLVCALGDEDENVKESACDALGAMGEKAATNEVISKLVSALGDENWNVRSRACNALGAIGEKAATSDMITKLVCALGEKDEAVRSRACDALGAMGEKAATSEVISKLVSALGDENWNVRYRACDALSAMGGKAATSDVVSKLASALGDKDMYVRYLACNALGAMGEKAATSDVISKLVCALGDKDVAVRSRACDALGKMGEKAATSEVISKLASALGDEDMYVRYLACNALGAIGEKAATSDVISKLVCALEDKDVAVRSHACDALGKMGEKGASSEVINKLLELVENKKIDVWAVEEILQKLFTSFTMMTGLDSNTVTKLLSWLERKWLEKWTVTAPELLIKVFLHTKDTRWLSIATRFALLGGTGVTIVEKTIVVYHSKEPVKLECSDGELVEQLVNAFVEQAMKLPLTGANIRQEKYSCNCCNVL